MVLHCGSVEADVLRLARGSSIVTVSVPLYVIWLVVEPANALVMVGIAKAHRAHRGIQIQGWISKRPPQLGGLGICCC
jgi:hypothetical protein